MDTAKGVLVFGEIVDGKLAPVTIELLAPVESWPMNWARN